MSDLRQQYLGAVDLKRATVDVPEWGGTGKVTVRELTFPERARFFAATAKSEAARAAFAQANEAAASQTLADPEPDLEKEAQDMYLGMSEFVLGEGRLAALVARLAVIDPETGEQVFGDENLPDLEGKSQGVLARIFERVAALSGLTARAEADALGEPDGTLSDTPSSPSASSSGDGQAKSSAPAGSS